MTKKVDYIAEFNTGDVIANSSKCGLFRSMRNYFDIFTEAYLAELSYDGVVVGYVWKTPKGLRVVSRLKL